MSWMNDADVQIQDVSDDPYGFGQELWPVFVKECREAKVGETGKLGIYVICEAAHDKYAKLRPFGRWIQLPTPKEIQLKYGTTFDPTTSFEDAKIVNFVVKWGQALGFTLDQIQNGDKVEGGMCEKTIQGKLFMARLKAVENDQGYDDIKWRNPTPLPDSGTPEGMEVFARQPENSGITAASGTSAVEAALKEEIENA